MTYQEEDKAYTEKVASDLGWGPDFGLSATMFLVQLGLRFKSAFPSLETILRGARWAALASREPELMPAVEASSQFLLKYLGTVTGSSLAKDVLCEEDRSKELRQIFNRMVKLLIEAGDASLGGMHQSWRDEKNEVLEAAQRFMTLAKPE